MCRFASDSSLIVYDHEDRQIVYSREHMHVLATTSLGIMVATFALLLESLQVRLPTTQHDRGGFGFTDGSQERLGFLLGGKGRTNPKSWMFGGDPPEMDCTLIY